MSAPLVAALLAMTELPPLAYQRGWTLAETGALAGAMPRIARHECAAARKRHRSLSPREQARLCLLLRKRLSADATSVQKSLGEAVGELAPETTMLQLIAARRPPGPRLVDRAVARIGDRGTIHSIRTRARADFCAETGKLCARN